MTRSEFQPGTDVEFIHDGVTYRLTILTVSGDDVTCIDSDGFVHDDCLDVMDLSRFTVVKK